MVGVKDAMSLRLLVTGISGQLFNILSISTK